MIKIILFIVSSLDGYIADENGSLDWILSKNRNEDYGFLSFYQTIDALVMGSKTYERFLIYGDWPYLEKKTYVFTQRPLTTKQENIVFVADDVNKFVASLRKENIQDELIRDENFTQNFWLVGGAKLIASFHNQALIDEYIITIIPKLLQRGILLPKVVRDKVGLIDLGVKHFDDGVVQEHLINS